MNQQTFQKWLEDLKNIWQDKEPKKIVDICTQDCLWYETPFSEPYKNHEQILADWMGILDQEKIIMTYEILAVNQNFGIAKWNASFIRSKNQQPVILEGIFKIHLDNFGKCHEFHQWVSVKP